MVKLKDILLAYDDSECAKQALIFACEFSKNFHSRLHIVSVCQLPQFGNGTATEIIFNNEQSMYEKFFESLTSNPTFSSIDIVTKMEIGNPEDMILQYAEKHKVAHIIVGHRGFSNLERWFIGSVARKVIDNAHCPVTVIRTNSYLG